MLEFILALFGSTGIGSIVGLIGGILNRKIDLQSKKIDHSFELAKLNAEREYLKEEISGRVQVVTIEADKVIEAAGYDAMAESFKFAAPTAKDGWIDKFSKLVRPVLTILFFAFTIHIYLQVQVLVDKMELAFSQIELIRLYVYVIQWALFQAGVSIGWWFAMRPGRMPVLGGK